MFEINNDLHRINYKNFHNWVHLFGTFALGALLKYYNVSDSAVVIALISYIPWFIWEIGDGFKPWYWSFSPYPTQSNLINYLRKNLLYSDKFSLQDVIVWDLVGALLIFVLYI